MASGNPRELEDHGIVVTGASSGIGRAIALRASALGARVVVHYRKNQVGAESTADEITRAGGSAQVIQADIQDACDRSQLIEESHEQLGQIDGWVNNAGADVLTGEVASADFETKMQLLWQVDVQASTALTRELFEKLKAQESSDHLPSIIFLGWDQASYGMDGDAGQMFGATKAAVMALARSFAQEFAPLARVNCIAPGWIKTAWGQQTTDAWSRRAQSSSLLARWGTPEDIAGAAAFLLSPAASFVNGQVLEVNGGWNRRIDS